MNKKYIDDEVIKGQDYTTKPFDKAEYTNCAFENCLFNDVDLSGVVFIDCEFISCDLSTTQLKETALRDVQFEDCKLLGLHFDDCNTFLFSVNFNNCQLNLSTFYQVGLKGARIKNCQLHGVDFSEANLTGAILSNSDLRDAIFDHTDLEKADLRGAFNYSINTEKNRTRRARFSKEGVSGLLQHLNISIE